VAALYYLREMDKKHRDLFLTYYPSLKRGWGKQAYEIPMLFGMNVMPLEETLTT
jgi:hypothetical protein